MIRQGHIQFFGFFSLVDISFRVKETKANILWMPCFFARNSLPTIIPPDGVPFWSRSARARIPSTAPMADFRKAAKRHDVEESRRSVLEVYIFVVPRQNYDLSGALNDIMCLNM
jgi:hypothetical protein